MEHAMKHLKKHCLLCYSTKEPTFIIEEVQVLKRMIIRAQLISIKGADHVYKTGISNKQKEVGHEIANYFIKHI